MFTMAGETFLIIGDSDGTGVSPTAEGMAARTGVAAAARTSQAAQTSGAATELASDVAQEIDFMPRSYLRRHRESVPPQGNVALVKCRSFKCRPISYRSRSGGAVPRGVFGIVTSSTPLVCLALIDSVLAPSGNVKRRRKPPETRSTRS